MTTAHASSAPTSGSDGASGRAAISSSRTITISTCRLAPGPGRSIPTGYRRRFNTRCGFDGSRDRSGGTCLTDSGREPPTMEPLFGWLESVTSCEAGVWRSFREHRPLAEIVVEKADLGGLAHGLALMGVELDEGRDRRRGLPGGLVQSAVQVDRAGGANGPGLGRRPPAPSKKGQPAWPGAAQGTR